MQNPDPQAGCTKGSCAGDASINEGELNSSRGSGGFLPAAEILTERPEPESCLRLR